MAKIAVYLTRPQIGALMNAATAMLAGQEGEGDFLCRADVLNRAANALAHAGNQTADEWIPVAERLPEEGEQVQLFSIYRHQHIGWLDSEGRWESERGTILGITHWQPLPAGPEAE